MSTELMPAETVRHVAMTCLCLHTQRVARALARRFDTVLRPFGLTNGQFSLLMALNRAEPAPIGRLADFLAMDRTTLTAALKPLERRQLVRIAPGLQDRRNRTVGLAPAGVAVLCAALPVWRKAHAAIDAGLGAGTPDRLRSDLAAVLNALCEAQE